MDKFIVVDAKNLINPCRFDRTSAEGIYGVEREGKYFEEDNQKEMRFFN